jgi:hypothetical protein
MLLQKKKHPRYRKKKTEEEKRALKRAVKIKEKQSLNDMLYSLPFDVKKVIYQMAIASNLYEWSLNHQKKYRFTTDFFDLRKIDKIDKIDKEGRNKMMWVNDFTSEMYPDIWPHPGAYFKHMSLCKIRVKQSIQDGIKDLLIPSIPHNSPISHRMWSNIDDHYWYHEKCRCADCDLVRIYGYKSLPPSQKRKYAGITWEPTFKQWNAKSFKQMKYEKNKGRLEGRRLIKQIKEHALMEKEFNEYVMYESSRS